MITFHLTLHFTIPLIIAFACFRNNVKFAYILMIATMLVDIDHLLATPIYDPLRCSIGFHPLHSLPAIVVYTGLCFVPKLRLVGIGLIVHMALDSIDCFYNTGSWYFAYITSSAVSFS